MKQSQAFATLRAAVVAELTDQIATHLVPSFNAEVVQIRERHEKARPESEALADHRKRAETADLVVRRDQFIAGLNTDMRTELEKRVKDYDGTIHEIEVEMENKEGKKGPKTKIVLEAHFGDKSTARFPKSLWVNYKAFDRV